MKVIFLDIDGVLNHEKFYIERYNKIKNGTYEERPYPLCEFCPESVDFLNEILNKTDAEIVLSSSWRVDGINKLNNIFKAVGICKPIYDVTPSLFNIYNTILCRGKEIDEWLSKHNVDEYIIIDDDNDMEDYQQEHFIKTNAYKDGLNEEVKNKAILLLS